jgi:hypothetical protein
LLGSLVVKFVNLKDLLESFLEIAATSDTPVYQQRFTVSRAVGSVGSSIRAQL